ncbi:MAG: hypothetical protein XE04_0970 [Marinimicrobia bacterium 46_43]|nr:MAG: hypothetical protein XE04_0970 [Marinimicrobia bacterium 46_43]
MVVYFYPRENDRWEYGIIRIYNLQYNLDKYD